MATKLHRIKGEQFFDDDGAPLAGGKLYYDEAGTTTDQTTYSNAAGSAANSNPLVLDASGRLTASVYFGDSDSFEDYKETLTDADDVTISNWPVDDLPAAEPAAAAAAFAPPLLSWTQVTSAASPVALTAANAGNAYEADTTSGNIEFDLPSAASVGDGKGFVFKKTVAGNSMIIDQSGSETIDNSATALTITGINTVVGIWSNGAEWYRIDGYLDALQMGALLPGFQSAQVFTSSGTYTLPSGIERVLVISTGGGGGGGGVDSDGTSMAGGAGGSGGGTCIELFTAAQVGASQTVTIGAAGAAGAATGGNGGAGGDTTFGSLHTAGGGPGGTGIAGTSEHVVEPSAGGTAADGLINISGGEGGVGYGISAAGSAFGGHGGSSFWGGGPGGTALVSASAVAGRDAAVRGTGGSGAANRNQTDGVIGGVGAAGIVVVLEFGS